MLGKQHGVAVYLRAQVPHLTEQHCVAYLEDLGIGDAWKKSVINERCQSPFYEHFTRLLANPV